ncbi:MAG: DUF4010 domain-containing protein [Pseudomonadota bacterium]
MALSTSVVIGLGVALGCGALIGIDRERRKGRGVGRAYAGLRSFAIASLCGALAQVLGGGLVLAGAALVIVLSAMAYWRDRLDDPGITTELALLLSYLLGVAAIENPELSAGVAVIVAGMLNLRSRLHHFARVSIKAAELHDALVLAGAALVVLPLLPNAGSAWLLGVNPKRLLGLAIAIMAIQFGAHVALRVAGARLGMALSGLASGFVSSLATVAAMGTRCRREPGLLDVCVSAALMSTMSTFALLGIVTATVAPALLGGVLPILACGMLGAATGAGISVALQNGTAVHATRERHAFSVRQALGFAFVLSGATVALAYANTYLGQSAALAGSALAGLLDVHAAAASVLSLAAAGSLPVPDAHLALLFALTANTGSRMVTAMASGGRAYGLRVALGLALSLGAAWAAHVFKLAWPLLG